MKAVMKALVMKAAPLTVLVVALAAGESPWCQNSSAPAQVGMYGPLGDVDLTGPKGPTGYYIDLPNSTEIAGLFHQGLGHLYGFNGVECLRSFETAAVLSPDCALCQWGVAMALTPNINRNIVQQKKLEGAALKAQALVTKQPWLTDKTRRLIAAVLSLVGAPVPDSYESPARAKFAAALCDDGGEQDPDIDAFCAGALMATTPWNYYQGVRSPCCIMCVHMLIRVLCRSQLAASMTSKRS